MDKETVTESAKAIQEVAKATGQALDLTKGFTGWVGEVVGRPVAEAVSYFITDRVQAARYERAIYDRARFAELLRKVDEIAGDRVINVRPLEPKVALPLIESATMEFDEKLHTLWAQLLATAINHDEGAVERQHVSILSELSTVDAEALKGLWLKSFDPLNQREFTSGPVTYKPSIEAVSFGDHVVANLTRLGLITPSVLKLNLYVPPSNDEGWPPLEESVIVPGEPQFINFTDLGLSFCRAVGMREPLSEDRSTAAES